MNNVAIFYPVFAMVLLVFVIGARLGYLRYRAVSKSRELARFYIDYRGDAEPQNIRIVSRSLINQFEIPVIFYTGAIIAYVTGHVGTVILTLAWIFVALRYLHCYIHLGRNYVPHRFAVFLTSTVVLAAFWIVLAVSILRFT